MTRRFPKRSLRLVAALVTFAAIPSNLPAQVLVEEVAPDPLLADEVAPVQLPQMFAADFTRDGAYFGFNAELCAPVDV